MLLPVGGVPSAPAGARALTLFFGGSANRSAGAAPNGTAGASFELPEYCYVVNASLSISTHAGGDPRAPENLTVDVDGDGAAVWAFTGNGTGAFGLQDRDINGSKTIDLKFDGPGNRTFTIRLPRGAAVSNASMDIAGVLGDIAFKKSQLDGSRPNDFLGYSVAGAGDLNRDGYDDIVAGAPAASAKTFLTNGYCAVVYGSQSGPVVMSPDIVYGGQDGENLGFSVAGVRDFNKDGYGEVLAGAINGSQRGPGPSMPNTGMAYLYAYDASSGHMRNIPARSIAGSGTGYNMGWAVGELPDIDRDGTADIAASEPYAPHGSDLAAGRVELLPSSVSVMPSSLWGERTWALFGSFIHRSKDLDSDGRPDLVIGNRYNAQAGPTGAAYVYLSKNDFKSPLVIQGNQALCNFSASGCTGDFNGDGYNDLAIGAPNQKLVGKELGAVHIFQGGPKGLDVSDKHMVLWGREAGGMYGGSLACPGDLDADGTDDLLVGSPAIFTAGDLRPGWVDIILTGRNRTVTMQGDAPGELFGYSVAGAGDVDGDGLNDLAIGAPVSSPGGNGAAGRVMILMTKVLAPKNPSVNVGGMGADDWSFKGHYARESRIPDLSAKLNGVLSNPMPVVTDDYGNRFNDIQVTVHSDAPGILIISNISIIYNWTATVDQNPDPATGNLTRALNNLLSHKRVDPPMKLVTLGLNCSTPGNVTLHSLSVIIDEAPVVVASPTLYLPEDTSNAYLLDLYTMFTDDFDPQDLLFTVDAYTNDRIVSVDLTDWRWLSVDAQNGSANDNWTGEVLVTVSGEDNNWLYNTTNITVIITPANDPPVFNSTPSLNATAGVRYTYQPAAFDAENGTVTFGLSRGPDGMRLGGPTGLLEWMPGENQYNRSWEVALWASDGQLCATQRFNISVGSRIDGVRITGTPPPTAVVGMEYACMVNASTNVANATLVYSIKKAPQGMTLSANGMVRWVPAASQAGPVEVSVEVTDGPFTARQNWTVTVFPSGTPLSGVRCGITEPLDGNKVGGTVKVRGYSSIVLGAVARVEVSVDSGRWKSAQGSTDWLYQLDTTGLSNGRHTVNARAFDGANYSAGTTVSIEVDNPAKAASLADPMYLGLLALVIALAVGIPAGIYLMRRKPAGAVPPKSPTMQATSEEFAVEDIFLIHLDGRLIHHATRRLATGVDSDILSSMLTAVTSFVKDALARTGDSTLGSLEYGNNKILLEKGKWTFLAVVINSRQEPKELREEMRQVIRNVESEYGGVLGKWDGNSATLADCKKLLAPLTAFSLAAAATPPPATPEGVDVELMSELEFYQGYVRLKVAVKNNSRSFIMDSALKVMYNEKALKLEKVEPDYPQSGREVMLGNIGIKEKKTVGLYLDPQICMESYIEGTLTFKDAQGELHHVDMKKKLASVVCPIMHTEENINIPMMRRMLEGELDQKDTKIFNLPPGLDIERAFEMCKRAVQGHDIRLVREFTDSAPSFVGEAWYFGKVKGRDDRLVVKTAVRADTGSADFYVASNSRLVVTGLLAELKNDLNKEYRKERPAETPMEPVTDESRRERIRKQGHLLDKQAGGEAAPGATRPPENRP